MIKSSFITFYYVLPVNKNSVKFYDFISLYCNVCSTFKGQCVFFNKVRPEDFEYIHHFLMLVTFHSFVSYLSTIGLTLVLISLFWGLAAAPF